MWSCFEIETHQLRYLRGPSIKVGRSSDCHIVFSSDKSISRTHANISIHLNRIVIQDLDSKFGLYLLKKSDVTDGRSSKCDIVPIQGFHEVKSGDIIQFGSFNSRLKFTYEILSFCLTRLEKTEKECMKSYAKILNAKFVRNAEEATHVISNKFAATTKMITAIVLKKHIVKKSWFHFLDKEGPIVIMPNLLEYSPLRDVSTIQSQNTMSQLIVEGITDINLSRSKLLSHFIIIILEVSGETYECVLKACGATVFKLSSFLSKTENNINNLIGIILDEIFQHHHTVCFFYQEETKSEIDMKYLNPFTSHEGLKCQRLKWLSSSHLALSIMLLNSPQLSSSCPSHKISQSQIYQPTEMSLQVSSQLRPLNDIFPIPTKVPRNIPKSIIYDNNSHELITPTFNSNDNKLPNQIHHITKHIENLEPVILNKSQIDNGENCHCNIEVKIASDLSTDIHGENNEISTKFQNDSLEKGEDVLLSKKRSYEDVDNFNQREIPNDEDIAIPVLESLNSIHETNKEREEKSNVNDSDDWILPYSDINKHLMYDKKKKEFMTSDIQSKESILSCNNGDDYEKLKSQEMYSNSYVQPVTAEHMMLRKSIPSILRSSKNLKSGSINGNATHQGLKDVRRFQKNFVMKSIQPHEKIRVSEMNQVLPRESEREIQLRLESERELENRKFREQLFYEDQNLQSLLRQVRR